MLSKVIRCYAEQFWALLCLSCWVGVSASVFAAESTAKVSVVFPEIKSAYAKVFEDIAAGVEQGFHGDVDEISVSRGDEASYVQKKIQRQHPDALIALGGSTLRIVKSLQPEVPILAGAVVKNGGKVAGISMIPDGSTLMEILLALKPEIKKVYVVSGNRTPAGLVENAQQFLEKKNIQLFAFQANSVREGAKSYKGIFNHVDKGDVVWILPGAPQLDSSVFALLLEKAWDKHLIVFSSNPSHVNRGVLFSVYPDNIGMGRSLGEMANTAVDGEKFQGGLVAVNDLFVGVNQRTAKHLGVNLQTVNLDESKTLVMAK